MASSSEILQQITALSKQPGFDGNDALRFQALQLSKQLTATLQKPEDAAIELLFLVSHFLLMFFRHSLTCLAVLHSSCSYCSGTWPVSEACRKRIAPVRCRSSGSH
jgi:hypothetical protein